MPSAAAAAAASSAPGGAAAATTAAAVTLTAEETKFLGGDVEHTHLVRGLDFALVQKMRREEKKRAKEEAEGGAGGGEGKDAETGGDDEGGAAAPPPSSSLPLPTPESELGRVALSTLLVSSNARERKKPDTRRAAEAFLPKRTVYLFDLGGACGDRGDGGGDDEEQEKGGGGAAPPPRRRRDALPHGLGLPLEIGAPATLVRAAADCPKPRALVSSAELERGGSGGGGGGGGDGGQGPGGSPLSATARAALAAAAISPAAASASGLGNRPPLECSAFSEKEPNASLPTQFATEKALTRTGAASPIPAEDAI